MTLGSLPFETSRSLAFTASFVYLHSGFVFAVPPPKPLAMFERLFIPFDLSVWLGLATIFSIALIVILLLKTVANSKQRIFIVGHQNRVPYLNMINVCLGGAIVSIPRRTFARSLLIVWLLGSLVLRNAYLGSLFKVLQSGKTGRTLSTIDDLIAANYSLYMPPNFFNFLDGIPGASQL